MNYQMIYFFAVLFLSLLIYFCIPKKGRWIVLLCGSTLLYFLISGRWIIFIILTSLTTYFGARIISKNNDKIKESEKDIGIKIKKKSKAILICVILINLLFIVFLKYFNFIGSTINTILSWFNISGVVPVLKLALPIGISFYTLTAIAYITDVYRGKFKAENNYAKVALYLSFFPTIMEGPIMNFSETSPTLFNGNSLSYQNLAHGAQRILWGLFKKMIIADRLYLYVKTITDNPANYSGFASVLFVVFYTIYLYADFSGFIDIAIGSSEMFGIKLPENFRQPLFAKNVTDFWRRWHITLGLWLKEYVFYSVTLSPSIMKMGSKLRKKHKNHFTKILPTLIALLCVWLVNGLWHGPEWKFIVYGMYYFVIIALGMIFEPLFKKLFAKIHLDANGKGYTIFKYARTIIIVLLGEMIFGVKTLGDAWTVFISMFRPTNVNLLTLGLDYKEMIVAVVAIGVLFTIDGLKQANIDIRSRIDTLAIPVRWIIYIVLVLSIITFGAYGDGYAVIPFVYGGF